MDKLKNRFFGLYQQHNWKSSAQQLLRSGIPPWSVTLLSALVLTVVYNGPFFTGLSAHLDGQQRHVFLLLATLLFLLNHLIISVLATRYTFKSWLIVLLFFSSISVYFMSRYGVMIDKTMLQNTLQTDWYEITGLFDIQLIFQLILYFIMPAWLLIKLKLKWPITRKKGTLLWLTIFISNLIFIGFLLAANYQTFSSVFRNYRELKHLAVPFNNLDAVFSLVQKKINDKPLVFQSIATDALQSNSSAKPKLLVVVVGETARADHFSINGYKRSTTPNLQRLLSENKAGRLFNFSNVTSCGTATAVSVPCMFSMMSRNSYNDREANYSENVLDVAQRVGINTLWIDNNSGCKGVCERIYSESIRDCPQGNCSDVMLVDKLRQKVKTFDHAKDNLVVLHQLGSHGPEYYKRSQESQKKFSPECTTNQFQTCTPKSIINAYDNSIVATDVMLAETIDFLASLQNSYNTALLYISDHGESLGEDGVYLHGLPYVIAPAAQTHVPMMLWLSTAFIKSHQINAQCLVKKSQRKLSHDDLFPTLFHLLNISSQVLTNRRSELDQCLSVS